VVVVVLMVVVVVLVLLLVVVVVLVVVVLLLVVVVVVVVLVVVVVVVVMVLVVVLVLLVLVSHLLTRTSGFSGSTCSRTTCSKIRYRRAGCGVVLVLGYTKPLQVGFHLRIVNKRSLPARL
jgi:hypothetical protein